MEKNFSINKFNDILSQLGIKKGDIILVNANILNFIIKGKKNCVILNYDEKLNNFLKWYQQLSAESLGKKGELTADKLEFDLKKEHWTFQCLITIKLMLN